MENRGILRILKPPYRSIWFAALFGGALGAGFTLGVYGIFIAAGHGESWVDYFLGWAWYLVLWPAIKISHVCGWSWRAGSVFELPLSVLLLMTFANAGLVGVAAGLVATISAVFRRPNNPT